MGRKGAAPARWLPALVEILLVTPGLAQPPFDHTYRTWDVLARQHVRWLPGGGQSRVHYDGFAADRERLKQALGHMSAVSRAEFERWSRPAAPRLDRARAAAAALRRAAPARRRQLRVDRLPRPAPGGLRRWTIEGHVSGLRVTDPALSDPRRPPTLGQITPWHSEPEVEDLHDAVGAQLDVGGLEITMDDPVLVRGFERLGSRSGCNCFRAGFGEGTARLPLS